MTAEVHYLYRKSWCVQAVEDYARHLGISVDQIPPNEQLAVVEAVKGALEDFGMGSSHREKK